MHSVECPHCAAQLSIGTDGDSACALLSDAQQDTRLPGYVDSRGGVDGNPIPFADSLDAELRDWLKLGARTLARLDELLDAATESED